MRKRGALVLSCLLLALSLSSCSTVSTVRGWFGGGADTPAVEQQDGEQQAGEPVVAESREEAVARLNVLVKNYIVEQTGKGSNTEPALIRKRPYSYREYVQYPNGVDKFDVTVRENDSRTRPLTAEVKMDKVRFSTQMHRDKRLAEEDNTFLRDTGAETLNYELRNGRWHRVGSLFVANKTEELIDGNWAPRREETVRVTPNESKPGFFKRIWSKVSGADTE